MSNEIVPFGKYRGRPVEDLAADPDYSKWLMTQSWFKDRFAMIYSLLAAAHAPQETPEHNQMQARFLDDTYCWSFLTTILGYDPITRNAEEFENQIATLKTRISEWNTYRRLSFQNKLQSHYQYDLHWYELELDRFAKERSITRTGAEQLYADRGRRPPIPPDLDQLEKHEPLTISHKFYKPKIEYRQFEDEGADLSIFFRGGHSIDLAGDTYFYLNKDHSSERTDFKPKIELVDVFKFAYRIELKPSIGDDYPAILRQVVASECDVVLTQSYCGVGASFDQVQTIFKSRSVRLILDSCLDV
jgi:hypothetical protein